MLTGKFYLVAALSSVLTTLIASPAISGPAPGLARSLSQAPTGEFISAYRHTLAPFAFIRFCVSNPSDCTAGKGIAMVEIDPQRRKELEGINTKVNRSIRPVSDSSDDDVWQADVSTGDCEDFALTKRRLLIAAGWSSKTLRVAVARTASGEGHAVLVIKTTQGDLVLDNRTNAIRTWNRTGLLWEKIQSEDNPKVWYSIY